MATIRTVYCGDLRTEAEHIASGNKIITDAPVDNQGRGEAYSPTDLLCAALGSCMLTIMGISARNHGWNLEGTRLEITKIMAAAPRRVSEVHIGFWMAGGPFNEHAKLILQKAAETCPVALSLSSELKQVLAFHWPE
jgi:uncharacterized OsmC-like protein